MQFTALDVTSFPANNVAGFGLLQRDIDFDHYQDLKLDMTYDQPLDCPKGSWEKDVELIEIPTNWETTDNIVAFGCLRSFLPGEPVDISYRMSWHLPSVLLTDSVTLLPLEREREAVTILGYSWSILSARPSRKFLPTQG